MRTKEEIIEKINEMMEREIKGFEECNETRRWFKNRGCPEKAKDMETAIKHHLGGYARLSELLDWINKK